ncbi:Hypothetical protein predicted by Glimmer/Critica (plasmid) [Sinorhizobium fredii HH103]|uniref:Uncharacterized protein n=1 Tax=Sinorhizobium fredii (strain HH103) TaxID=1117943 RepID=G9AGU1_SINF1|nr:hypothetical protein AB395_00005662 [Sinorhizobium fredii CCBAU 45436]AWM28511.1 hypothetical protein AOX55_00005735 [Sinorhizobium fredii CCBAU 25509]CCF00273.1 Hypothetical protein predicted by Glimmer/Critica [Sinorhizobium fredii HH103]
MRFGAIFLTRSIHRRAELDRRAGMRTSIAITCRAARRCLQVTRSQ